MNRLIPLLLAAALGAGCAEGPDSSAALTASRTSEELTVFAYGELVASESLPIALPPSVRMGFNISWMAPEFSDIRAGDVIARFDDVQVRLDQESTALNVAKSEFKLANVERSGELEKTRIGHETIRVEGERDISEAFATVDERLFSRNEIIDALSDLDFLDVEASYLSWQAMTFDQRTQAEENLIKAERQGELTKLEKQETALGMMELRSPADGTFVYARTPWGEKLGKGKRVFPGMPIGLLPVRGKVKARLYVPENDAVGLAEEQRVKIRLDAAADRLFDARVVSISPVASPRNRKDPQKFFSVEAVLDQVDPDLMKVGSRLRAHIITGEVNEGILVPAQSVFSDADSAYVFLLDGATPVRHAVVVGQRSPDLVEITEGLDEGDRVSLIAPGEGAG
ncbi:MAG: HlyD family efflux transporter periplasmic adaptor subunit [Xanthomonadales bacterium]|nr:HlyD family efflux transporter periplasmic adaptor subunit [Xanthomonadales bacterium]